MTADAVFLVNPEAPSARSMARPINALNSSPGSVIASCLRGRSRSDANRFASMSADLLTRLLRVVRPEVIHHRPAAQAQPRPRRREPRPVLPPNLETAAQRVEDRSIQVGRLQRRLRRAV